MGVLLRGSRLGASKCVLLCVRRNSRGGRAVPTVLIECSALSQLRIEVTCCCRIIHDVAIQGHPFVGVSCLCVSEFKMRAVPTVLIQCSALGQLRIEVTGCPAGQFMTT